MPRKADLNFAFRQPPEKAIKYFRSKGYTLSWDWQDTFREAHAKAFTVAKVANMDVLQDIRKEVDRAISEGITFREFRSQLEPRLKARGWWGKKEIVDEETGEVKKILEGSPHRLKTIYRMNTTTAFNAGREAHFQENKKFRPYGQYVAVLDPKTRETHRELHGLVFPLDDPFWDSFTPPIDWNCRCRKRALSERALKRRGLTVSSSEGRLEKREKLVSPTTGETRPTTHFKTDFGWMSTGPGFDFNPYKAAFQPDLDKYDADIARKYLEGAVTGPDFDRFFQGKFERNFPVGVIDTAVVSGVQSKVVRFSSDSLKKNKGLTARSKGHPELSADEYHKLPSIFSQAQVVVKKGNIYQYFALLDRLYVGTVKVSKPGEMFLQNFHRTGNDYMERKMRKGEIIKNDFER